MELEASHRLCYLQYWIQIDTSVYYYLCYCYKCSTAL